MKFQSTAQASRFQRHFWYGDGGCGKTKGIGDFHEAGQNVVLVSTEADGPIPLQRRGLNVLHLIPQTQEDLMDCVTRPSELVAEAVKAMPEFAGYEPKTWAFDGLRSLQRLILKQVTKGPGNRHVVAGEPIPSNQDYRVVDLRMRNFVAAVELMPYHTIMTAHYEKDLDIETHLSMTGDQRNDKDVVRKFQGYPSLEGFSLKYDLPGLCASFYLYMTQHAGKHIFYTQNTQAGKARTRIAEAIETSVDWTNKNIFELFQERLMKETK